MIILGIETSCDETGVAVVEASGGLANPKFEVLGSAVHSQIEMHREYGGVYPNVAKREHIKNLPIVLAEALGQANIEMGKIDKVAVTVGPGLEPALWTGITFAEELSQKYEVPIIPTNHMVGHLASVLLKPTVSLSFPAVALLISGGHTELIFMQNWEEKKRIGETQDDAVGEAFDKVARMLGLPYPGGPEISKLATLARQENLHLETPFPRPMIHSKDYNFSFSGLKTAVLYYLRNVTAANIHSGALAERGQESEGNISEVLKKKVAREFEDAVAEVLVSKSKKAIMEFNPKTFIIGGGVIANDFLKSEFQKLAEEFGIPLLIPEKSLTTDNAIMIAMAGYFAHLSGKELAPKAQGNLKI